MNTLKKIDFAVSYLEKSDVSTFYLIIFYTDTLSIIHCLNEQAVNTEFFYSLCVLMGIHCA